MFVLQTLDYGIYYEPRYGSADSDPIKGSPDYIRGVKFIILIRSNRFLTDLVIDKDISC